MGERQIWGGKERTLTGGLADYGKKKINLSALGVGSLQKGQDRTLWKGGNDHAGKSSQGRTGETGEVWDWVGQNKKKRGCLAVASQN